MPIDPNIPLQGRLAQIDDPATSMQKVVAMRNLIQQAPLLEQQNKLTALKLKQEQEDMKDQETLGQIYNEKGGDLLEVRKALPGKVSVRAIMQFDTTISNHLKDLAAQDEAKIKLNREKSARLGEISNGMVDGRTFLNGIQQAVTEGVLSKEEGLQALSLGLDPNASQETPDFNGAVQDTVKHWQQASLSTKQLHDIDLQDRQEARAEAESAAKRPGEAAKSQMEVNKLLAMKSTKPEDWDKIVDAVAAPTGLTKGINMRTKSLVRFSIGKGDFDTAQKEIDKARDEVSAMERTRMGISARKDAAEDEKKRLGASIGGMIMRGEAPPVLQRMYAVAPYVMDHLSENHFNLTEATKDWTAINQHLKTLNSTQQLRLRQAVNFTYDSLDILEQLYNDWTKTGLPGGFKEYNKAALVVASHLSGPNGAKAQALLTQINDLTAEMATVYKGGGASTDDGLKLAAENLKGEWNELTFKKALNLLRTNLQIRRNSINTTGAVGVSVGSRYLTPDLEEENPFPGEEQ